VLISGLTELAWTASVIAGASTYCWTISGFGLISNGSWLISFKGLSSFLEMKIFSMLLDNLFWFLSFLIILLKALLWRDLFSYLAKAVKFLECLDLSELMLSADEGS
jgi:hypothetical protein